MVSRVFYIMIPIRVVARNRILPTERYLRCTECSAHGTLYILQSRTLSPPSIASSASLTFNLSSNLQSHRAEDWHAPVPNCGFIYAMPLEAWEPNEGFASIKMVRTVSFGRYSMFELELQKSEFFPIQRGKTSTV